MSALPIRRIVADVMTTQVHVASPLTPFKYLVRMIQENRVSAIPIVDQQGIPIGIVSEADLLLKEIRPEQDGDRGLLRFWRSRIDRAKAEGVVAADLMASPVLTVPKEATLARAARLMQERSVKRLVVVDDRGRVAGIVSRSDLLQVFLRTDEDIRDDVVGKIIPAVALDDVGTISVDVLANVVTLSGEVDRRTDAEILTRMCRDVDGVVDVVNQLMHRWDDTRVHAPAF